MVLWSARKTRRSLKTGQLQCSQSSGTPGSRSDACHEYRTSRDSVLNLVGSQWVASGPDSAGNSRGLIEADVQEIDYKLTLGRIPRGTPAASLKRALLGGVEWPLVRIPRGTPAASLKPDGRARRRHRRRRIPRGTPAASLKRRLLGGFLLPFARIPRGTPAASLKPQLREHSAPAARGFRGELPRPH